MWPLAGMPKIQTHQNLLAQWPPYTKRSFLSRNGSFSSGFWIWHIPSQTHTHTHTQSLQRWKSTVCVVCLFFLYRHFAIYLKCKIFLLKGCLIVLWKPQDKRLLNNPWLCPSSDYFSERDHKTSWKSPEAFQSSEWSQRPFSPIFLKCHSHLEELSIKGNLCMHKDQNNKKRK